LLKLVLESLPAGAHYTNIVSDTQTITVDATATRRSDVIDYARRLEEAGLFSEVRISSMDDVALSPEDSGWSAQVVFKISLER
jgi:hypothetical protein